MTYADIIAQFMYRELPSMTVPSKVRFEAISAEIFGTKQRRLGPMPTPEVQTAVRDVLKTASSGNLQIHIPWGSSKQDGGPLDILEFFALKQLVCLRDALLSYGQRVTFMIRVEDLTDEFLFEDNRLPLIADYALKFESLARYMLGGSVFIALESRLMSRSHFKATATDLAPVFYAYLQGNRGPEALREIGWMGDIPTEQRDHYYRAYETFYPGQDHKWLLARYFAATAARHRLKGTAVPSEPHISISFAAPVEGSPVNQNRLFYRTLPARFTHQHRSPWMATGYFAIAEDNACTPKIKSYGEVVELQENYVAVGPVSVRSPYLI